MVVGLPRSRRSGSPKTETGKLASSRNSLKIGVYSSQEILPGEDPVQFQELKQHFIEDLQPRGATEEMLVHEVVVAAWKKLRLQNLETRAIAEKLARPIALEELNAVSLEAYPKEAEQYLLDSQKMTEIDGELAKEELATLKRIQEEGLDEEVLAKLKKRLPSLFEKLYGGMLAKANYSSIDLFDMATLRYTHEHPRCVIETVIEQLLVQVKALVWVVDHQSQILDAHQNIYDARLDKALEIDRRRAFDDLDRSLYKSLSELRKQQAWRQEREFEDVQDNMLPKSGK